jgi:hypothetical protein
MYPPVLDLDIHLDDKSRTFKDCCNADKETGKLADVEV